MAGKRLYRDLFWGLAAACVFLAGFIVLSQSISSGWLKSLDDSVGEAVRSWRSDGFTQIAMVFNTLGKSTTEIILFLVVGAILYFKFKRRWETLMLFLAVLGTWGLNTMLKGMFERERPAGFMLVEEGGFSFPSGTRWSPACSTAWLDICCGSICDADGAGLG
ncbi:phosphatase PAP2 family protein [Paenibacillus aestuarii]|uniref:Phosphatase PAP2 family protein n=1 Tax=Paenibacillus aestuarii TaxID=516965 RepID=A0ABW0K2G2_9BACL|nr:hypothetical protein [Paenibacillus aestuarii]